ncbi:ATPase involved in chromosome partitioning (plasmid) [Phaeobacter piscinae]|uniref:ATPase involved in chromosome partitioning n=1 Tax=Phaeobacter piscinae TaxID=1580596 RepID=A0ABN5DNI9_9RHOB|nr:MULTISPECIES: ParA family protein [Phaeobacter]ATG38098.1 ATPase involved in chromosome partitioning [Phaeobacter piscinae]AUQ88619.1 ATPase involved in chromosome partitioning [Phaeobacter piscinae]AUQ92608.1 ATPase involved in chromosome partitioning [Phaeobacter inhibens]AUR26424.1 ATPase involved in chromosome partitioning [Phaeobacter piscinae]
MFTITLMNQKGGAGKSTVARALLSAADNQGLKSAFIDADQTGNLANWAVRAAGKGYWSPNIDAYQTMDAEEVEEIVDELEEEGKVDLLILDTAGDASRDHDIFATVADLILCPILLTQSDVDTARGTANYIYRMKDRAEDPSLMPEFRILLNQLETRPSRGDSLLIQKVKEDPLVGPTDDNPVEVMKILSAVLLDREAFKTMDSKGLLGRTLERHNETAQAFRKNPKYMKEAIAETEKLLNACMAIGEGK